MATENVAPECIICEYIGKLVSGTQFSLQNPLLSSRRSPPYVLRYCLNGSTCESPADKPKEEVSKESPKEDEPPEKDKLDTEEIFVDAREYGNMARYVRRSCRPNANIRHLMENGSLHLYLIAMQEIQKEEEITVPFDFDYTTW